ncbi:hypothetical protein [Spirillospora sp. NPDC047279]|uniref:hypothetical protein n=1 Tax=Spirillospora sp. NPDC047279 TaxID=3155478 RepID=UPI003404CEE9
MSLTVHPTVRYEVRERVGVPTLDRPKAENALSREIYAAVRDVARAVYRRRRSRSGPCAGRACAATCSTAARPRAPRPRQPGPQEGW